MEDPISINKTRESQVGHVISLIDDIAHGTTTEQLSACQTLVKLEGIVVRPLTEALSQFETPLFRKNAIAVLNQISENTLKRKDKIAQQLFCSRCLLHFETQYMKIAIYKFLSVETIFFHGCKSCGQSQDFFTTGKIIAVLDTDMNEERLQTGQSLRVNWLKRRSVFDFDSVEIIKTDDKQAEHFAIQVGNDNDSWRRSRYKEMQCQVSSDCGLSENTLRILKNTFGTVKIVNPKTKNFNR